MRFARDDKSLELHILGYQFPGIETERYDSNWLVVEGKVAHPRGGWTFRDPCLLTYEVRRLADWLDSLARDEPSSECVVFVEPNLELHWIESDTEGCVRVTFDLKASPPWAARDGAEDEPCRIDFPVTEIELRRAAASLREQLEKYPQRGER